MKTVNERKKCVADDSGLENACCEAPEGTIAVEKHLGMVTGTKLESLEILKGWYRHTPLSVHVLKCRYEYECKGGNYKGFFHVPRALLFSIRAAERILAKC